MVRFSISFFFFNFGFPFVLFFTYLFLSLFPFIFRSMYYLGNISFLISRNNYAGISSFFFVLNCATIFFFGDECGIELKSGMANGGFFSSIPLGNGANRLI